MTRDEHFTGIPSQKTQVAAYCTPLAANLDGTGDSLPSRRASYIDADRVLRDSAVAFFLPLPLRFS